MIVGSNLEKVLRSGQFTVTAEMGPPKSADPKIIRQKARILKGYADAMNITDNQTAIVRMSSIASGALALEEGVEPIIQMTCRDRNRLAIQADLLGASALGLKNLLCLTGDHQSFGNHPQAKGVFDIDSIQQIRMVRDMRDEKKFQCGETMPVEPRFFIGCAANPFADPFQFRAIRLGKKVAAGADFAQTQIVYNVEKFAQWMEIVRKLGLHKKIFILAGVSPIKSVGAARYMKTKVPGMDVPDWVVDRMAGVPKEEAKKEGIRICIDIIKQVKQIEGVAGVHIMAIEWEDAVPEIVEAAGLLPRPKVEDSQPVSTTSE
ncbi:MAG: methylenetetrahydrofolate reductase [Dehalococcoidia bacterium]|nr:methylenetetrahydrofolate reductase [Dehalococcoidia bacterium]